MGFSKREVLIAAELQLQHEPAHQLDNVRAAFDGVPTEQQIHLCDITISLRNVLPSVSVASMLLRMLDPAFIPAQPVPACYAAPLLPHLWGAEVLRRFCMNLIRSFDL